MRRAITHGALVALAALVGAAAEPIGQATVVDALQRGDIPATREALAAIARESSIDDAAKAFAAAVESLPRNREFRARFDALRADGEPVVPADAARYLFVFVPGWLYRANPDSGADLARPRAVLGAMGLATHLVPLDENGTVEANGAALAAALAQLAGDGRRLVLVSTSKGGPETHLALDQLRRSDGAGHVAAWVNIGGLLNGTARADWWMEWPQRWLAAVGFAFLGRGTGAIPSMMTAPRRARFAELRIPGGVVVVNYIGAPFTADIRPDVRADFEVIAPHGPNDGLTLLADALVPQGITVVERGLDHYFSALDIDRRIAALAAALLGELEAPAGR
jgi:hypothetical protein